MGAAISEDDRLRIAPGHPGCAVAILPIVRKRRLADRLWVLLPVKEVVAHREADALNPAFVCPTQRRVEHVEAPIAPYDAHGPELIVVEGAGISDREDVRPWLPDDAVARHGVADDVVIRQGQIEEVQDTPVGDHLDVTELGARKSTRREHGPQSSSASSPSSPTSPVTAARWPAYFSSSAAQSSGDFRFRYQKK